MSPISVRGMKKKIDQILTKIHPENTSVELSSQDKTNGEKFDHEAQRISATSEALSHSQPTLTPSQVEEIVKSYILQNPQIISDALDKLQQVKMDQIKKQVQESILNHKSDLESSTSNPTIGNKDGKSIVVMFFDYNCAYCKQSADAVENLVTTNKDTKVILKVYPILGSESEFLARISLAVNMHNPNKFHEIHKELLSNKLFDQNDIVNLLKKHKINYQEIEKLSESDEITNQIKENLKLAKDLRINGVPAFIINGNYYPGFLSPEQLIEKSKPLVSEEPTAEAAPLAQKTEPTIQQ